MTTLSRKTSIKEGLQRVPASNVGGDTTDLLGRASSLVNLGQTLGTRLQVVVPAEPATVTGINVHDDVVEVKGLERVRDTLLVAGLGLLACGDLSVGDQVGQGVGLDDERESLVGVRLEDAGDDWVSMLAW